LNDKIVETMKLLKELHKEQFLLELEKVAPGAIVSTYEYDFGVASLPTGRVSPYGIGGGTGVLPKKVETEAWIKTFIKKEIEEGVEEYKGGPYIPPDISTYAGMYDALIGITAESELVMARFALAASDAGVKSLDIVKLKASILTQDLLGFIDAIDEDIDKDKDKDKDGSGKEKFKTPGYSAFTGRMQFYRAMFGAEESKTQRRLVEAGVDRLNVEDRILDIRKENLEFVLDEYDSYISLLRSYASGLKDEEQRAIVAKSINDLDIARFNVLKRIDTVSESIYKTEVKQREESTKRMTEFLEGMGIKIKPHLDEINKIYRAWKSIADIQKTLDDISEIGGLLAVGDLNIAKDQLSTVEERIRNIVKLKRELDEGLFSTWPEFLRKAILGWLNNLTDDMMDLRVIILDIIENLEAGESWDKMREDMSSTLEGAISSALTSHNVKDALQTFADMMEQMVAQRIAKVMIDRWLGPLLDQMTNYAAATRGSGQGVAAAGASGVGGGSSTIGWIGVAIMAASWAMNAFSNKTLERQEQKLDYILRGQGYQLPSTFVLDEPGEFSSRRRGRDSFTIRFPQRSLAVDITTHIEVSPRELMKITAASLSTGGQVGAKQHSYLGD
jgi:hypothetical protein